MKFDNTEKNMLIDLLAHEYRRSKRMSFNCAWRYAFPKKDKRYAYELADAEWNLERARLAWNLFDRVIGE
jgi:hypothetical protein